MATYTEHYHLTMPEERDPYLVEDFNENFETLDTLMAETENGIHEVNEKMGTPETSGETVFEKLSEISAAMGQGSSLVKSIQRVTVSMKTNEKKTLTIQAVDTSRSMVFLEQLAYPGTDYSISYSLHSDSVQIETSSTYSKTIGFGFWIIEFI